ncbi:MAG: hypothetical protein KGY75_06400, partial [Candidatus Cloacimonetes bacterium]|nr:hypothetical protein [Candidatus Cloacimonadota bacterium]
KPKIYGSSSTNSPEVELWSGNEYTSQGQGWVEFIIPSVNSIEIGSYTFYWVVIEVDQNSSGFPIGIDGGPPVDNADLIQINTSGSWTTLSYYGLNYNWLIEVYISN